MQKLLAALFSALLMFGAVACTVDADDAEDDGGTTVIEGEDGGAEGGEEGGDTDVEVDADADAEADTATESSS